MNIGGRVNYNPTSTGGFFSVPSASHLQPGGTAVVPMKAVLHLMVLNSQTQAKAPSEVIKAVRLFVDCSLTDAKVIVDYVRATISTAQALRDMGAYNYSFNTLVDARPTPEPMPAPAPMPSPWPNGD